MNDNVSRQIEYYENLLEKYGDHFLSLDWKDPEQQQIRFKVFGDLIKQAQTIDKNLRLPSILDVGCGFGDLYGWLKKAGVKCDYTGFDISGKILTVAKEKYPSARFSVSNMLESAGFRQCDFIFCSGSFNIRMTEEEEHLKFVKQTLLKMFDLCKVACAANFLSTSAIPYVAKEDLNKNQYYYFNPEYLLRYGASLATRYALRHDYSPGDFTLYLLK